ncbi:HERC2 [Symbiodinium sp. CCMP2592]|nr:HERC2 [Symbiodinium sp. CCMP2592]
MVMAEDEDIVGQDIEIAVPRSGGRTIPSASKRPKVEHVSDDEVDDDEESEDEEEVTALAAAQPAEPRNEVEKETKEFRTNAVHVYGLDFLKTNHMEEIFSQFGYKYVEWLNASSANIIFKNAEGAKKALEALSFPKTEDEPWRRTPDILVSEDVPPIFLQMRLATADDVKKAKRSVPKAMTPMHYAEVFHRNQAMAMRQGGRPRQGGKGKGKSGKPKAGTKRLQVSEEEVQKRQKRTERFGDDEVSVVQPGDAVEEAAPSPPAADAAKAPSAGPKRVVGVPAPKKEAAPSATPTTAPTPAPKLASAPPKVVGVPAPKIASKPVEDQAAAAASTEPPTATEGTEGGKETSSEAPPADAAVAKQPADGESK